MVVVVDVPVPFMKVLLVVGEVLSNILSFVVVDGVSKGHPNPASVCENEDAPSNMTLLVVTLDTSHLDRSPLNDVAK